MLFLSLRFYSPRLPPLFSNENNIPVISLQHLLQFTEISHLPGDPGKPHDKFKKMQQFSTKPGW